MDIIDGSKAGYRGTENVGGNIWMSTFDRVFVDPLGDAHDMNEGYYSYVSHIPDQSPLELRIQAPSHQTPKYDICGSRI